MISQYLLDPEIDLTSEETQWRDVSLWYQQMAYDEFQFTDRMKFFAVKWLLENRKWPHFWSGSWRWRREGEPFPKHCILFSEASRIPTAQDSKDYWRLPRGNEEFGNSILWFCSLWPKFYLECVLPPQENEPTNPDEFWENLQLCVPGEDWESSTSITSTITGQWRDEGKYSSQQPYYDACDDPTYRWTYGNAILRAIQAWRNV